MRPPMRKITKHSVMLKDPAYMRNKTEYAQRVREREREAQRIYLLRMQQLQLGTTNLYKRLQGHFI